MSWPDFGRLFLLGKMGIIGLGAVDMIAVTYITISAIQNGRPTGDCLGLLFFGASISILIGLFFWVLNQKCS